MHQIRSIEQVSKSAAISPEKETLLLANLDERRQFVQCHLPSDFVVGE
jgi:hypothetical protein